MLISKRTSLDLTRINQTPSTQSYLFRHTLGLKLSQKEISIRKITRDQYHSKILFKISMEYQQNSIYIVLRYTIALLESCEDGFLVC